MEARESIVRQAGVATVEGEMPINLLSRHTSLGTGGYSLSLYIYTITQTYIIHIHKLCTILNAIYVCLCLCIVLLKESFIV